MLPPKYPLTSITESYPKHSLIHPLVRHWIMSIHIMIIHTTQIFTPPVIQLAFGRRDPSIIMVQVDFVPFLLRSMVRRSTLRLVHDRLRQVVNSPVPHASLTSGQSDIPTSGHEVEPEKEPNIRPGYLDQKNQRIIQRLWRQFRDQGLPKDPHHWRFDVQYAEFLILILSCLIFIGRWHLNSNILMQMPWLWHGTSSLSAYVTSTLKIIASSFLLVSTACRSLFFSVLRQILEAVLYHTHSFPHANLLVVMPINHYPY